MIRWCSPEYQHMQQRPNQRSNPPNPLIRETTPSHSKGETLSRMHRRSTVASSQRSARETNQAHRRPYRKRRREHAEELLLARIEGDTEGEEPVFRDVFSFWYCLCISCWGGGGGAHRKAKTEKTSMRKAWHTETEPAPRKHPPPWYVMLRSRPKDPRSTPPAIAEPSSWPSIYRIPAKARSNQ